MDHFIRKETVRMYDVDGQGIVHYASYYRFFTNTLEEYSKANFGDYLSEVSDKTWFVTVESKATYHKPVKLGDVLEIHMNAEKISKSTVKFNFQVFKEDSMTAEGYLIQVCIDPSIWKAKPIPEEIIKKLSN